MRSPSLKILFKPFLLATLLVPQVLKPGMEKLIIVPPLVAVCSGLAYAHTVHKIKQLEQYQESKTNQALQVQQQILQKNKLLCKKAFIISGSITAVELAAAVGIFYGIGSAIAGRPLLPQWLDRVVKKISKENKFNGKN